MLLNILGFCLMAFGGLVLGYGSTGRGREKFMAMLCGLFIFSLGGYCILVN